MAGTESHSGVLVLAHRGLSETRGLLENSIAAFSLALETGANVLETDVQVTRDGVPVLFHDASLKRIAGVDRRVSQLTWAEIQLLLEGQICSLEQALTALPKAFFNLDIKTRAAAVPSAAVINRLKVQDRVRVTSFSETRRRRAVRSIDGRVASSASAFLLLLVYLSAQIGWLKGISLVTRQIDSLQIPRRQGRLRFDTPRFIESAKLAGLEVHYWTINSPAEMRELIGLGADGLVTDRCDLAVNIAKNRL
ncbi:MAG: hypothetical protein RIS82_951 [Actinomycetota bacterium]|jgi:glycerophosphoryl diester phosphodiesterase